MEHPRPTADDESRMEQHKFDECPTCSGELQYQTQADVECLTCGEVFWHEARLDRHHLWDYDDIGWMRGVVASV